MSVETAPRPEHEPFECDSCGADLVMIDGDKRCSSCGLCAGAEAVSTEEDPDPWEKWWSHRAANYSGFTGPQRIKCVGGFPQPYFEEN